MEELKATTSNPEKKYRTWKKEVTKDDMTECIRVEEVTNGFIITKEKYGTNSEGKYISKTIRAISFENPMEPKKDEDDDMDNNMFDSALKAINGMDGGLFI